MNDRDRGAPIALARDQPVPQPVVDRGSARAALGKQVDHPLDGVSLPQAVERAGVDVRPVIGGRLAGLGRVGFRGDDHLDGQVERPGEVQVALIVRGHRHDRAGAVVGQHVVRGVHRDLLAVDGVDRVAVQEDAGLRPVGGQAVDLRHRLHLGQIVGEVTLGRGAGGELRREVAVGRHHEEGGAEQRVRPGGEHRHRFRPAVDPKVDLGTQGPADPVALHRQHLVRPLTLKLRHVVQQPVGIVGDAEVPLRQLALDHQGVAALAAAVDHLLVGQHGLTVGAPVDVRGLAVRKPALVHLQEEPLIPVVVLRVTGVERAVPVERAAVAAHGCALGGYVLVRPTGRVDGPLDGGVLSRQAEGVPTDRVQDVVALLHPVARQDVTQGVGLGVAHVEVPRRVGEHVQHVLRGPDVVRVPGAERGDVVPDRQPALLQRMRVVGLVGGLLGCGVCGRRRCVHGGPKVIGSPRVNQRAAWAVRARTRSAPRGRAHAPRPWRRGDRPRTCSSRAACPRRGTAPRRRR